MKNYLSCLLLSLAFCASLPAQQLVSSTLLGSKTKAQLASQFQLPFFQYGVKYYRITYTTTGLQGQPDTVSGLVVVPNDAGFVYPRLVYQHGTSSSKTDVPSFNVVQNGEGIIGWLFGGLGYVTLMPDYLGLGVSDGFHPYVHAASEASVAADMLRALPEFLEQTGFHTNDQLFITGYSQGGHAAMALHREVETELAGEFSVTAAAHLSGPYSIGEVMRDLILSDSIYYYPAYLPNTILSYQTVYGNLFSEVNDVFKAPYSTIIGQFYAGAINLNQMNSQLIAQLTTNEGACRPFRMLQPAIVQAVLTDPAHPFNAALQENNVYAWAPEAPTRIFYCTADDQVPYKNSFVALDSMVARGASQVAAQDLDPTADHGECVTPALTNTILFFVGYQQVAPFVSTSQAAIQPLAFYPSPANTSVTLRDLPGPGRVSVFGMDGRLRRQWPVAGSGDTTLSVAGLENGLYYLQYTSAGKIGQGKLVIQR